MIKIFICWTETMTSNSSKEINLSFYVHLLRTSGKLTQGTTLKILISNESYDAGFSLDLRWNYQKNLKRQNKVEDFFSFVIRQALTKDLSSTNSVRFFLWYCFFILISALVWANDENFLPNQLPPPGYVMKILLLDLFDPQRWSLW